MGQIVVQAAAAVAGYYIGGPTGAQIGWTLAGAALGSETKKVQGAQQPLMDLKITGTEYGQCIPYVRGAARIAGQMWWNTDRRPTTTTTTESSGGGKGGGGGTETTTSTTTYDMDCLIGLTDNEIVGIARIWNNGKLMWTSSSGATAGSIAASEASNAWTDLRVYTGSMTQLPDATYEAAVGAANAIAYRGRSYVFIEGLKLGQSGQVPNLTFEVVADGGLTPDAPTIGTGTGGIAQVSVTFTPPAEDGGLTITGYTVTATATGTTTPVIATGTGAASPIVVSGLADATTYDFTVHATNAAGDSPESGIATATTLTHYQCEFDAANKSARVTLSGSPLTDTATGDSTNTNQIARATLSATTGKHYAEFHCVTADTNVEAGLINSSQGFGDANYITLGGNGYSVAGLGTVQAGDIVGVLFDGDAHTIEIKLGNVSVATYTSVAAVAWYPAANCNGFGYPPTTQWLMKANNDVTYAQAGYDGFDYYA